MSKQQKTVFVGLGIIAMVMMILLVWSPSRRTQPAGNSAAAWLDSLSSVLGDMLSDAVGVDDLRALSPAGVCRLTRGADNWRLDIGSGGICRLEIKPAEARLRRLTLSHASGNPVEVRLSPKRARASGGASVEKTVRPGEEGYEISIQDAGADLRVRAVGGAAAVNLY